MELFTTGAGLEVLMRWLHVFAGVIWIGVLYYFNFIQTPFFGTEVGGPAKGPMTRGLVPNALWWFRWGAMFTFLSGWAIVGYRAMSLGIPLTDGYMTKIMTGGLMGTFMFANVWFVIWPAQQVVIANAEQVAAGGDPIPEAAARGGKAGMASRTNTPFSIPMLSFMTSAANLPGLLSGTHDTLYLPLAGALLVPAQTNGLIGPAAPTPTPPTSVPRTHHPRLPPT